MATTKARKRYLDSLIESIYHPPKARTTNEEKRRFSRETPYIKSRAWKCPKSPTGAHHWIIRGEMMWCKYCPEERRVDQVHYIELVI